MPSKASPVTWLLLIILAAMFLFPFAYLIGGALKTNDEALTQPNRVFSDQLHFENFTEVFKINQLDIPRQTVNSLIMTFAVTFGQIMIAALAGYAFARIKFWGRDPLFVIFLATLIVPFELLFVPLYIMLARWGWINTYLALIIPSLANPFAIFIFRQFFLTVPTELEEAMTVDGAGYLRIFWSLMLPLSVPAATTVFILTWLAEWSGLLADAVHDRARYVDAASGLELPQSRRTGDDAHHCIPHGRSRVSQHPADCHVPALAAALRAEHCGNRLEGIIELCGDKELMMKEWSEGYVAANGLEVFYHRSGSDGGKPPILLLHGITDNGWCWSRWLATSKRRTMMTC
jgi:multiple sugar transport system permease protein